MQIGKYIGKNSSKQVTVKHVRFLKGCGFQPTWFAEAEAKG